MAVTLDTLKKYTHAELREHLTFIMPKWSAAVLEEILRAANHPQFAEFAELWDTATTPDLVEKCNELQSLIVKEVNTSEYILQRLANWLVSQSESVVQQAAQ